MGIWHRVRASYREAKADALRQANEAVPPPLRVDITDAGTLRKQDPAVPGSSAAEGQQAAAAARTVPGDRAGYMPAEEAESLLLAAAGLEGPPPLRLVPSPHGLEIAAENGRLIDHRTPALRHVGILAVGARGVGHHDDLGRGLRLRVGQHVGILREPDDEHGPRAVALTTGRPPVRFGYVDEQRAGQVAELLDSGQELDGIVLQAESPRVLIAAPALLAALRQK